MSPSDDTPNYHQKQLKQRATYKMSLNPILNLASSSDCANNQASSNIGTMSTSDNLWHQRAAHLLALQLQQQQRRRGTLVGDAVPTSSLVGVLAHGSNGTSAAPSREVTYLTAPSQQQTSRSTAPSYLAEFLTLNHNRYYHVNHDSRTEQTQQQQLEEPSHKLQAATPSSIGQSTTTSSSGADGQREARGIISWPTFACHTNNNHHHQSQPLPQRHALLSSSLPPSHSSIDIYSRHISKAFQLMLHHHNHHHQSNHQQNHSNHNHHYSNQQQQLRHPSRVVHDNEDASTRVENIYSTLRDYALSQTYMGASDLSNQGGGVCQLAAMEAAQTAPAGATSAAVSVFSSDLRDNKSAFHEEGRAETDGNNRAYDRHCHLAPPPQRQRGLVNDCLSDCGLDSRRALSFSPNQQHQCSKDCTSHNRKPDRSTSAPSTPRGLAPSAQLARKPLQTARLARGSAGAVVLVSPYEIVDKTDDYYANCHQTREGQTRLKSLQDRDRDGDGDGDSDGADHVRSHGGEQLPGPGVSKQPLDGCNKLSTLGGVSKGACNGLMGSSRAAEQDDEVGKTQTSVERSPQDKPHSEPPKRVGSSNNSRIRTAYSSMQILNLEREFSSNMYLSRIRRIELSQKLKLSEKQVKIWFQNRRVKHKKETSQQQQQSARSNKLNYHHQAQ